MKILCQCNQLATWCYMPSSKNYPYFCDNCVPRGCSCNHNLFPGVEIQDGIDLGENPNPKFKYKVLEKDRVWAYVDENDRFYPCCEYFEDEFFDLTQEDIDEYLEEGIKIKYES